MLVLKKPWTHFICLIVSHLAIISCRQKINKKNIVVLSEPAVGPNLHLVKANATAILSRWILLSDYNNYIGL